MKKHINRLISSWQLHSDIRRANAIRRDTSLKCLVFQYRGEIVTMRDIERTALFISI